MKLLDFAKNGEWYQFRVARGLGDEYEDFIGIVNDLKELVPSRARRYYPEKEHLWAVLATPDYEEVLCDLFENGRSCIDIVKLSRRLPGL